MSDTTPRSKKSGFDGAAFLALMRERGFVTFESIASKIGCDRRTIARWAGGSFTPQWQHLDALEDVLGTEGLARVRGRNKESNK